jgi:hypothetical protein
MLSIAKASFVITKETAMQTLLCPPNATAIGYTFLRSLGLMLDELSAQGLTIWQDERQAWRWAWVETELQATRGFWALGEAIVDAVATRYPAKFDRAAIGSMVEIMVRIFESLRARIVQVQCKGTPRLFLAQI